MIMWKKLIYLVLAIDGCETDAHADSHVCLLSLSSQLARDGQVDLGTAGTALEGGTESTNAAAISADVQPHPADAPEHPDVTPSEVAPQHPDVAPSEVHASESPAEASDTSEASSVESNLTAEAVPVAAGTTAAPSTGEGRQTPWSGTSKGVPPPHEQAIKAQAKMNIPGEVFSLKPEGFVGFPKDNPKSLVKNALADRYAVAKQLGTTVSAAGPTLGSGEATVDGVLQSMYNLGNLIKSMPKEQLFAHKSRSEKPTSPPYAHARDFSPFGIWQKNDADIPVA